MGRRKTTVGDVARAAGVSIATVDRVLNGRGGVRPEREAIVLEWARKLKIDRSLESVPVRWLRIAVFMQATTNPYYARLRQGFQLAQKTYKSHKVLCLLNYFDDLEPRTIARGIPRVAENADGLVIVAYEHPEITAAIRSISRKIPVVTLASDLPNSGRLAYVGLNNERAGRVSAELLGRFVGPAGGDVLLFTGKHDFRGHEERESGFRAVLGQRFPNCKIIVAGETHEEPRIAERLANEALRRHPATRGIYCISVGCLEISRVLANLGRAGSVVLIGHDLSDEHSAMLLAGTMDAVVDHNPRLEAIRAVELLLLHHRRIPKSSLVLETPVTIYVRESLPGTAGDTAIPGEEPIGLA